MTYASDLSDMTTKIADVTDAATAKTALQAVAVLIADAKALIDTNTNGLATVAGTANLAAAGVADLQITRYSPATHIKPASPYENGSEITASSPSLDGSALISLPSKTAGWNYADINITTSATLGNATSGSAYSQQLAATGGVAGDTKVWTLDSRTPLPSGLSLSSTGLLSGTHTGAIASPTSGYIVTVADAHGNSVSKRFSLAVV